LRFNSAEKESAMEEALRVFLEFLAQRQGYSDNTIAAYSNDLSQFTAFLRSQDEPVDTWRDVGQPLLEAYVSELRGKRYASSTVARKVAAIKSYFHFLHNERYITSDPTNDLESPKVKKRLPRSLDTAQVQSLLAAPAEDGSPKSLRDRALLTLLYATGMRVTEVVTLSIEDADLEHGTMRCESQDHRPRLLPLTAEALDALRAYLERGRPFLLKKPSETALFLNHRGERLTRQGLWLIIKVRAKQAGLPPNVTPHTLRHSFAAHRLSQGSDLREVQRLLGHANISTTHIYTQIAAPADETA
jgi:integrase/recombinase XerD